MTDVVARDRPVGPTSDALSRARCTHCAMPVRETTSSCWSCGLDPSQPGDVEAPRPSAPPSATGGRPSSQRPLVGVGLALVLVVLLGCITLLASPDRGRGVRGLAARIRGDGWQRAEVLGASAEFPAAPVRHIVALDRGLDHGDALTASTPGLRTELLVAEMTATADAGRPLGPPALAEQLLSTYAAAAGGRVAQVTPHATGDPGLDALLTGSASTVRVRVTMAGSTGYLMAVAGPPEAFERFTRSFQRVGSRPGAPPPS